MNQYPNLPEVIMPIEETKLQKWLKTLPQEARERFEQQAENVKPLVQEIHSHRPTTQFYYGEYMKYISILTNRAKGTNVKFWGICFLLAGADQEGIQAAVKNL